MTVISHARLPLPVNIALLQKEVAALLRLPWLPHYNLAHYTGSWDVLPLRSPGGSTGQAFAELNGEAEYGNTLFLDQCPYLQTWLDSIRAEKKAVRLLNLKAGASIKPHRDIDLCFESGEMRLHLPVFTNSSVEFILDGNQLKIEEGSCWYINANLTHSLHNRGLADRIHLVVDCIVNDWAKTLMNDDRCEKVSKKVEVDRQQTLLVIKQLLHQNTETSLALARQLEEEL